MGGSRDGDWERGKGGKAEGDHCNEVSGRLMCFQRYAV